LKQPLTDKGFVMDVLAQSGSGSSFFLVVMVIVIFFLFSRAKRQATGGKKRASFGSLLEPAGKSSYNQPSPEALVQWEVKMHETQREVSARLDSKMAALEQLIREANRAAARLEAALAGGHPESFPRNAETRDSVDAEIPVEESSRRPPPSQADALRLAGAAVAKPQVGEPKEEAETCAFARPSNDRRYEEIYALADYGLEPGEIAQRVGTPVGEVELILSLRNRR